MFCAALAVGVALNMVIAPLAVLIGIPILCCLVAKQHLKVHNAANKRLAEISTG